MAGHDVQVWADARVWPPDTAPDGRFATLPELVEGGLARRVRQRLGGAPLRVAQSAVVMGVASRLWSLTVVPAVRHGVVVEPDAVVARDDGGAVVLGVRSSSPGAPVVRRLHGATPDDADVVLDVVRVVLDPVLALLPLAPRLLWGNVAATLHAVPRVHDLPTALPLVEALLTQTPLAGELDPVASGVVARRRTCCLFYLVPGAGLCGDCVLTRLPAPPGYRGPA